MLNAVLFTFEDDEVDFEYFIENNTLKVSSSDEPTVSRSVFTKEDWLLFLKRFKAFYNNEIYLKAPATYAP